MATFELLYGDYSATTYDKDGKLVGQSTAKNLSRSINDNKPDPTKRRKPTGWLYPTPYQRTIGSQSSCRGFIRETRRDNGSSTYQTGVLADSWGTGSPPALPGSSSNMRRAAEIEALVGLKKQRINLGVALREAQMTADYLGTMGLRVSQFYRAVRKRTMPKWNGFEAPSSAMTKAILEQQYALAPLLSDVYGAAQALRERNDFSDWVVTTIGKTVSKDRSEGILFPGTTITAQWIRHTHLRYKVRLDYIPANEFLSTLASLGMTNPLEVIWEAVPFSFMIDWAVPIGDWLSAMDATLGYKFLSGSCSESKLAEFLVNSRLNDTPTHYCSGEFHGRARSRSLSRTVYLDSPIPAAPRIKNPLSLGHMRNGLSLMYQALFGRRG